MFGKKVKLFTLLGFEVKIDLSWLLLAILITWSLARGLFPHFYPDLNTGIYWWMGALGALGLFLSIVFHELSHSMIARRFGLPIRGITLFIFGGVAEMHQEPESAQAEFYMAVAGPAASIVAGGFFYGLRLWAQAGEWSIPLTGVVSYLAFINLILAGFNLFPAFPLDGGRILRSALWAWKKKLKWATRIASNIGAGFGFVLIFLGVFQFVGGNFIGGVWWFLIGLFMRNASHMSYQQVLMRKSLEGEKIERFMKKDPVTVDSNTRLSDFIEDYLYQYNYKMFPVVDNGQLKGCITVNQVKAVAAEKRPQLTIREVMTSCDADVTIQKDEDVVKALSIMRHTDNGRLMVVDEQNQLVGVIVLKDLLRFFSRKVELEDIE